MEQVWAKLLKTVREAGNFALFGLISHLDDLEFTADQITIRTHTPTEFKMVNKYLPTIHDLAGTNQIFVADRTRTEQDADQTTIARLKDLFGDKVEIM